MADAPKILGTESLRQAYPKLNQAIDKANKSDIDAASALARSLSAEQIALLAEAVAQNTKDQFNLVVAEAGTNNPEVVQARGGEVNLNTRLDKVTSNLEEKMNYTDIKLFEDVPDTTQLAEGELGLVLSKPEVIRMYPFNGAMNVDVDTPITISFDIEMDVSTINNANIKINNGANDVSCLIGYDTINKEIIIIPQDTTDRLKTNTFYSVTLSKNVKSASGKGLQRPYKFGFTTGAGSTLRFNDTMSDYVSTGWVASGTVTQNTDHVLMDNISGTSDITLTKEFTNNFPTTVDYLVELIQTPAGSNGSTQFRIEVSGKSFIVGLGYLLANDGRDTSNVDKQITVYTKTYTHIRIVSNSATDTDFWINGIKANAKMTAGTLSGGRMQFIVKKGASVKIHHIKLSNGIYPLI